MDGIGLVTYPFKGNCGVETAPLWHFRIDTAITLMGRIRDADVKGARHTFLTRMLVYPVFDCSTGLCAYSSQLFFIRS